MKTVILAGGLGTRLAEYTDKIPKPMVQLGTKPILSHIMNFYQSYGYDDFIIAAGYKKEIINEYYKDSKEFKNLKIVDTGKDTMTGGRLLRLKSYFNKNEDFFMTYGDGLCAINLDDLKKFHKNHKKVATVTAGHPPVRFGELEIIVDDPLFYHNMRRSIDNFDDTTSDTTDSDMIRLSFVKQGGSGTKETIEILIDDYFITEAPLPIPEDKGPIRSMLKIMPKSIKVITIDPLFHS